MRIAVGLLGVATIAVLDWVTDPAVGLSVLYPIPILWMVRTVSVAWGVATSFMCNDAV